MNQLPSIPPRGITWPMVAYTFVRELPALAMVLGGLALAVVMARQSASLEGPITAILGPAMVAALHRSKPAEALDVSRMSGG